MDQRFQMTDHESPRGIYIRLWEESVSAPDVFAFLANYPDLDAPTLLEVLLVDQHLRWRIGQPLSLRTYIDAFPHFARATEFVRTLADNERREKRRAGGGPDNSIADGLPRLAAEKPTESVAIESAVNETESDQKPPPMSIEPPTDCGETVEGAAARNASTRIPLNTAQRGERLSFDLDEAHQLRAEAEALRSMLNASRFTPLRRLGAGGMGVVFEAYDQDRGDLVALKTMRRVDPQALVRFKQEFRSLCDISHPNLVNLYELFAGEDRWFFTMELVEGIDFITYVRNARPAQLDGGVKSENGDGSARAAHHFDEARLRSALLQLAEGAEAIHQASKLHRDIKPTNVLVTPEGRVVLLDFGLTADLESTGVLRPLDRQIVGTLAHMSPEQALGRTITAASDWYSVGVMLYESLTGELPYKGDGAELVVAKQNERPPSAATLVPNLPPDLVELCDQLLERDPSRRPTGRDVLARLQGEDVDAPDVRETSRPLPLIGRARHREFLDSVFAALARGKTQSVFVLGGTGTGKSTLVRTFLDQLDVNDDAVVLSGRCYERESVPYKALDSLIDSLARYLRTLETDELERLLPPNVAYLSRVFPVLQSVGVVAEMRRLAPDLPDQQEVRRLAIEGLRDLMGGIAQRAPLVLAIDDLQWGDIDSALLLSDLLASTQSPVLLFIGCFRSEDSERSPFLHEISRAIATKPAGLEHRVLSVEPLTQAEARELALALLGKDDAVSRAQAHVVARESGGNPLFVDELVKHIHNGAVAEQWSEIGRLDLDEVLWSRIKRQSEEALRLLGVVSISGRPIEQSMAFEAAELGGSARVALGSLRAARLIRCLGRARKDEIEIYHDRIRETVVSRVEPAVIQNHHRRLANLLLESGQFDPEVLAAHLSGAGDNPRACDYYDLAGDQAAKALAFDHAARLYRFALELHANPREAPATWISLGNALANAGRGAESATAYLEAAKASSAAAAVELKRLAATQLLISGHVEKGLALLRLLLKPLGLSMPNTLWQAGRSLVWNRLLLQLRGLRFRKRDPNEIPPRELARIDLCWSAVAGLSMIEPVRGADFQARGLLLALRAGEPVRLVRAIAMEAAHRSTAGEAARPRVASLLKTAEAVAESVDSHYARGIIEVARGASSIMTGRWRDAQNSLDEADRILRNYCTGVAWERDTVHNFALWALLQTGQIPELRRRWSIWYRESREKGDRYAASMLTKFYMTMLKLAANEPVESESELEASLEGCRQGGFNLEHSSAFDSLMQLNLYRGDIHHAWERLGRFWPEYSRSLLLEIQMIRITMLETRARTALAMAEKFKESAVYLNQARQDAIALEREGSPWAKAHARYVRAGIAACGEDAVQAALDLTVAAEKYDEAEMPLRAWILRYRLSEIEGGTRSRPLRDAAESWMNAQGIVSPLRWAGMYAPGFANISGEGIETSF
jgi:serine/threonine protein kinase/tetratricopeptide (TPR) repeat protein